MRMETKSAEEESVKTRKQLTSTDKKTALPTEIQTALEEIASLRNELKKEQERAAEEHHRLLYLQADLENYRNRMQKEIEEVGVSRVLGLVAHLITILDELELALLAAKKSEGARVVVSGVEMVLKKLHNILEKEGLMEIKSVGQSFDAALHNASTRVETKDCANGTVVEEIRKGYTFRGRLLRPSLVKIAVTPRDEPQESDMLKGESK
jgi:molecular chaperone GrpE